MEKEKGIKIGRFFLTLLAAAVVLSVFSAGLIYGFDLKHPLLRKIEQIIPYPAAIVDNFHWISMSDFENNSRSVKRFYENQDFSKLGMRVDFNTADGEKRLKIKEKQVLQKMIEDRVIQILAEKEGIRVSAQDLEKNVDQKIKELGNEEAIKDQLRRLYGWSIEDFKEKVVRPALYQEGLEAVFNQKYQDSKEARNRIEEAQKAIEQKKKTFSEVVAEFSNGSSSQTGGELGWFRKDQIIPEIAEEVYNLNKGEQSSILESPLGFHIVELEERKIEGGVEMVRIRQVFSAKKTFADWLGEKMKEMKVAIPLKEYYWDKTKNTVDFQSSELRDFEQRLLDDPQGDASAIF